MPDQKLTKELYSLYTLALKQIPNSPEQLQTRKEIKVILDQIREHCLSTLNQ